MNNDKFQFDEQLGKLEFVEIPLWNGLMYLVWFS